MITVTLCCVIVFIVPINTLPNFVFLVTDDQDLTLRSVGYMQKTIEQVADQGMNFTNFYVNIPICCPSRSTILSGLYPHNSGVVNNSISGGCSSPAWQENHEVSSIAATLKSAKGYKTFYAGKYLNQYGEKDAGGVEHVPKGYDWWLGLKGNSRYYNYTLSVNGTGHFFQSDYLTDQITYYALNFLNEKSVAEGSFFMMLAPPACHAPFTPAPRHEELYPDLLTVRDPAFNATPVDKHWLVQMPPTSLPEDVTNLDEIYRNRIRTLLSVDDMVGAVVEKLEELKILNNTYVIVMSDNGFHIGQFTQPWDKREPYESDTHVPFMIRGPNIAPNVSSDFPVTTVDILPTILDLAGITEHNGDGHSFKEELFKTGRSSYDRNLLVEYWGEGDASTNDPACPWGTDDTISECVSGSWCKCQDSRNNTYSCLLAISNDDKFKFCEFEGGFTEAYNLTVDPYELNNLKLDQNQTDKYLTILNEMKQCKGQTC
ncbi:hypothetical protein MTP99_006213 [Tenebrio molitor]|nr:hypothetical protein MTP99_006213 [Tenebrio molitor]